ncbi:MAG: hypothetical protein MZV64_31750 [Ignavibacteriales bacterium]|nr:hypothetical protein [Ignavibacteriales bacterium]
MGPKRRASAASCGKHLYGQARLEEPVHPRIHGAWTRSAFRSSSINALVLHPLSSGQLR